MRFIKINKRVTKILIPIIIMASANAAFIYNEIRISKIEAEKIYREIEEMNIVEAVLRWEIQKHLQTIRDNQGTICISTIRGFSDNMEFVKRFNDLHVSIKQESSCISDFDTGVRDKETNRNSIVIYVSGINWETRKSVTVSSGYREANLSASGEKVFVEFRNAKWEVTGEALEWISKKGTPIKFPSEINGDFSKISNMPS